MNHFAHQHTYICIHTRMDICGSYIKISFLVYLKSLLEAPTPHVIPSCYFRLERFRCADWGSCSAHTSAEHRSPRRRTTSCGGRPHRASWHRRCRTDSTEPNSSRVRRSVWIHGCRAGADQCHRWATNRPGCAPWLVPTSAAWRSRTSRWCLWAADRDGHSPWNRTSDRWSKCISPARKESSGS